MFGAHGLVIHERVDAVPVQETLGSIVDGRRKCCSLTDKRYFTIREGIDALLRRRKVSGELIRIVVGHCTYAGLVARELLTCFSSVHKFVAANIGRNVRFWETAREELSHFRSLLVLSQSDWARAWSTTVGASDASEHGWGISCGVWPSATVASCGRTNEKPFPQGRFGVGTTRRASSSRPRRLQL